MKKNITRKLIETLSSHPHRTFKPKELARMLSINKIEYPDFRDHIKTLAAKGQIARHKRNQYGMLKRAITMDGELHVKTQGYGFLITGEGKQDVFISQKNMATALDKDTVRVQLFAESKGKSVEGRVIEVLKRARQHIVGTYRRKRNYGFVVPDELKVNRDVFVPEAEANGAKSGQKVVVEIISWDNERTNPEGRIVEIIGFPDEPGVDVMSVVKTFDLPTRFPEQVETAAGEIATAIPAEVIQSRLDLRDIVCFTIDPDDAKDFDDAVSLRSLDSGNYELGVHIADVSHYVTENSELDREALMRGTSIYLVDRVIPMLPEKLSNEVCSLRPEEDRLTFSCIMEVTPGGNVVAHKIAETVIHSKKRFTYEDVQALIDGDTTHQYSDTVRKMAALSKVLIKKRRRLGSLDFDLPEVKIKLDEEGIPVEIQRRERLDSHRLVEEFMLLANQTVTEHIDVNMAKQKMKPPFIYRIHEPPDQEKMDDFRSYVQYLGFPLDPNKKVTGKLLGNYLDSLRGKPEKNLIENLLLRSMMKAKYSIKNPGHFGLAFKHYTHFTSPIRRYPDLAVHRLLKMYTRIELTTEQSAKHARRLDYIATSSSEREIVATEAERESIKLKKVEYMQRHLGDEFEGIISGVVSFGVFVELDDLNVEGLIHISDLDDDYYLHDEQHHQLIGTHSNKTYRLGDRIRVKVVRVDVDERIVDFILSKTSSD